MTEQRDIVATFTKQAGDLLFKIWPEKPLLPGEYALIQYSARKQGHLQVWDFGVGPAVAGNEIAASYTATSAPRRSPYRDPCRRSAISLPGPSRRRNGSACRMRHERSGRQSCCAVGIELRPRAHPPGSRNHRREPVVGMECGWLMRCGSHLTKIMYSRLWKDRPAARPRATGGFGPFDLLGRFVGQSLGIESPACKVARKRKQVPASAAGSQRFKTREIDMLSPCTQELTTTRR